ncbi:hypothetical protein BV25DRAFT_1776343, partial [Artomyces pyxidatus]
FLNAEHPSFESHVSRLRREQFIPVLVGSKLPKRGGTVEETEALSRFLLMLFKPWRTLEDLKSVDQTWSQAYDSYTFSADALRIMANIHVEHECRDARDSIEKARR